MLKPRYENQKERLDMEVKNLPLFQIRERRDRTGWFFGIMGVTFREFMGLEPECDP
jgi:hypothetical protein